MSRAALFPGQGAQFPGMGRELASRFEEARAMFDRADEVLGIPLSRTLFEGSEEEVGRTDLCQPGIFLVSAATMEVVARRRGLGRDAFACAAGLSLGEYTALWFAGALAFEDALRLTRARGRAMQAAADACPSG
ncbi:MAG: ACP S-malonyltransferase, partial [Planctomycetaceae bacterium]|nr:ACP S-malonyltransferase [Planctomycetaceae bacterium]